MGTKFTQLKKDLSQNNWLVFVVFLMYNFHLSLAMLYNFVTQRKNYLNFFFNLFLHIQFSQHLSLGGQWVKVLKERVLKIKPGEKNYPINKTHLYLTNALVNDHNNTIYQAAHTQKAQIKCIDIVVGDMSDDLKNKVKEKIPDDPTKPWAYIVLFQLLWEQNMT